MTTGSTSIFRPQFSYIKLSIDSDRGNNIDLTAVQLMMIINKALLELYGEVGRSITVDILKLQTTKNTAILRTRQRDLVKVWSSLTLCSSYDNITYAFRVSKVSDHLMALAH